MDIVPQLIVNSVLAGALYTLMALGFNLVFSTTKFFNMAHGAFAAIGGYAAFYLLKHLELNLYIAVIIAVAIAGLSGWLMDRFVFLPMRRKKATPLVLLVASLGLLFVVQAVNAMLFSSQFHTLNQDLSNIKIFEIAGGIITSTQIWIIIAAFVITALLLFIIERTKFGKAVQAIGDDEEVAKVVGIRTNRVISWVFVIGAAIAGVAGIATGFETGLQPTTGMPLLLKGVIASIIGGVGNVYGSIIGAFVLGFVENFGIWKISGEWKDAIAFALLIVFLIFRPEGILKRK